LVSARSEKEVEKAVKNILGAALAAAKLAGSVPGSLLREIERLLKPKVPWKRVIRSALEKSLGDDVKKTWSRPSRKGVDYPYKEPLGRGKVIALVDISGSITQRELRRFMSEVYGIAKATGADVDVVMWDVGVKGVFRVSSKRDIARIKVRGGGGTIIREALEKALKMADFGDVVVVLSDFELADFYGPESRRRVAELWEKLSRKAEVINVSVFKSPGELRRLGVKGKIVKLDLGEGE